MQMSKNSRTTAEERSAHVRQANANQALEGFLPSEEDKAIQSKYINGTATPEDLLNRARETVAKSRKICVMPDLASFAFNTGVRVRRNQED
jgi:hypothetical protein